jgi:hypothetical protein
VLGKGRRLAATHRARRRRRPAGLTGWKMREARAPRSSGRVSGSLPEAQRNGHFSLCHLWAPRAIPRWDGAVGMTSAAAVNRRSCLTVLGPPRIVGVTQSGPRGWPAGAGCDRLWCAVGRVTTSDARKALESCSAAELLPQAAQTSPETSRRDPGTRWTWARVATSPSCGGRPITFRLPL